MYKKILNEWTEPVLAFSFGGFLCWTPGIIVHSIAGGGGSNVVLLLAVLMPITAALTAIRPFTLVDFPHVKFNYPLALLFGMWFWGPVAIMMRGGGFAQPDAWQDILMLTFLFPMMTFMMFTYNGSLLGLLIATIILLVFTALNKPHKPSLQSDPNAIEERAGMDVRRTDGRL